MKISIDRIKKEKKVEVSYQDTQFENSSLREHTTGGLNVNVILSLAGETGVMIKGDISGEFSLECDRCCTRFSQHKKILIDEVFEIEEKEISSRMIDLDTRIHDIVLTSFPMKILCNENCKGICSGCGANLNKEECKCKK